MKYNIELEMPLIVFILLFPVIFFLPLSNIYGEGGYKKGGMYFEIKGGELLLSEGMYSNSVDRLNKSYLIAGLYTLNYGSTEELVLNYISYKSRGKTKISANSGSFLFEYGYDENMGVGFDIQNRNYNETNIPVLEVRNNLFSNWIYGSLISEMDKNPQRAIVWEIYDPLIKRKVKFHETTFNAHITYHFLSPSLYDFYVRLSYGYGQETLVWGNITTNVALTPGFKIYASEDFYINSEISAAYLRYLIPKGDLVTTESSELISIRFGLGLAY